MTIYCIKINVSMECLSYACVNISFKYKMLILCMCNFKLCYSWVTVLGVPVDSREDNPEP